MSYSRLRSHLLSASFAGALAFGATACNGTLDEQELALGEATAFLTLSEEAGEGVAADAVVDASSTEMASLVDEQAALAGEVSDEAPGVCDFRAKRDQVLAEYDKDGDRRLSREELRALRADLDAPSLRSRFFRLGWRARLMAFGLVRWAFDEDGSRTLSPEERAALVDALEARCERLRAAVLERFDVNKNGSLEEEELRAARQAFREKLLARRQEILANYDANKDGVLQREERAKLREDRMEKARERRAALIAQYDTNGDGKLSVEEALPLRKEIQRRIIEGLDAE